MSRTRPFQLAEVESWLGRYRAFRSHLNARKLEAFKSGFRRLADDLRPIQNRAVERARECAPEFNVFRILRLERKEVITHTPFLANLLNPAGSHAQGDLFLRHFWERLIAKQAHSAKPVQVPALVADKRWVVTTERVNDLGNFDIHLQCRALGCQMVIENKIGAVDQEDQLPRYWKQMGTALSLYPHRLLVYLTPQLRDPARLTEPPPPFTNLTYREDIFSMLKESLACVGIRAPRLRYSLEQYLDVIEAI